MISIKKNDKQNNLAFNQVWLYISTNSHTPSRWAPKTFLPGLHQPKIDWGAGRNIREWVWSWLWLKISLGLLHISLRNLQDKKKRCLGRCSIPAGTGSDLGSMKWSFTCCMSKAEERRRRPWMPADSGAPLEKLMKWLGRCKVLFWARSKMV